MVFYAIHFILMIHLKYHRHDCYRSCVVLGKGKLMKMQLQLLASLSPLGHERDTTT